MRKSHRKRPSSRPTTSRLLIVLVVVAVALTLHLWWASTVELPRPTQLEVAGDGAAPSATSTDADTSDLTTELDRERVPPEPGAITRDRPASGSTITGVVISRPLGPIAGVPIELRARRHVTTTRSRLDGTFSFEELTAGTYSLHVGDSLSAEFLPPWQQDSSPPPNVEIPAASVGYYGTIVTLRESDTRHVTLRVFVPARVWGTVVDPNGLPVPGAAVRIHSEGAGLPSVVADATTDQGGAFELLRVYPGDYRTQVRLLQTPETFRRLSLPQPVGFTLLEGVDHALPPLRIGAGHHMVIGSVVDQDRDPMPGIAAFAYVRRPADQRSTRSDTVQRTKTDEGGRFALAGLPPGDYSIGIGDDSDYHPNRVHCRLAHWVEPIAITIAATDPLTRELDPVEVLENRPFTLKGRIDVVTAGVTAPQLKVCLMAREDLEVRRPGQGSVIVQRVLPIGEPLDEDGMFRITIRAPAPPQYLVVTGPGTPDRKIPIDVEPGGERTIRVTF